MNDTIFVASFAAAPVTETVIKAGSKVMVNGHSDVLVLTEDIVGVAEVVWSMFDGTKDTGCYVLVDGTTIEVVDGVIA